MKITFIFEVNAQIQNIVNIHTFWMRYFVSRMWGYRHVTHII